MARARSHVSIGQDAGAATPDLRPASSLQVGRPRRRRSGVIASVAILTVFSLLLLAAAATRLPSWLAEHRASQHAMPSPQAITGSIVHHPATDRCRRTVFSNETGRVLAVDKPCESNVKVDEKGVPIPVGTAGRLEAISKSFSK
jgi:hypothetical protein